MSCGLLPAYNKPAGNGQGDRLAPRALRQHRALVLD